MAKGGQEQNEGWQPGVATRLVTDQGRKLLRGMQDQCCHMSVIYFFVQFQEVMYNFEGILIENENQKKSFLKNAHSDSF